MQEKIGYYAFKLLQGLANLLPANLSYYLARKLGSLLFYLVKRRRKLAVNNIQSALDYSKEESYDLAKLIFQDIAIKFIEVCRLSNWSRQDFETKIEVEGLNNLEQAYNQEQGVVLFTGHFGNWELLGVYLSWLGYPVNAIAREYKNSLINKEVWQIRESQGATVFNKDQVKSAFKALLKKELLLILGDQDAHGDGEFVQFFHRLASTPKGPVVLAQKAQGLILPVYLVREGPGKYRLFIEEPLEIAKEAKAEEREEVLQKLTTSLEEKIREYPEQWLWLHRRWKTAPPKEDIK
ncbi:hypothetical protein JCM16358_13190 [Halanaerocella petrolearia]